MKRKAAMHRRRRHRRRLGGAVPAERLGRAVFDPDPEAARKIDEVLANARLALPALSDVPMPNEGPLTFHGSLAEAVAGAKPRPGERARSGSSSSTIGLCRDRRRPTRACWSALHLGLQGLRHARGALQPANIIVVHPFNPVYLLPLVEVSGSPARPAEVVERAAEVARAIGMYPLVVRKEIDAFIGDRFLEAVWREALWLMKDGVATTEEIDDAIRMGFGLRWAQMGLFETYRIAGGEAGMRHFMAQFGPALEWPWTKLMDVPEFNDELVDLIASQSDAQSGAFRSASWSGSATRTSWASCGR